MNKLALGALFAGLVACGGGGNSTKVTTVVVDGSGPDGVSGACNPLTQTGCNAGEKCNWIYDQLMPTVVGHIGCEAEGTTAIGGDCGNRAVGPDSCVKGAECVSGECKQICDNQGGAPMCDADHACVQYQNTFVDGTNTVAGVCDPGCDPLTQRLKVGNAEACGSADPTKPAKGCYGYGEYSCSGTAPTVPVEMAVTLTDRVAPAGDYLNACAPGFMPILISETGSSTGLCNGLCAALESDQTKPAANEVGDAAALAKNPTAAAPAAGNAVCTAGHRGSATDGLETCRFLWIYNVDDAGMINVTPYTDIMGVCFARNKYRYDSNGDGMLDANDAFTPECHTLKPHTNGDTVDYDDAGDFFCQKLANDMFAPGANTYKPGDRVYVGEMGIEASIMRALDPKDGPVPVRRHAFAN